jgi:hypothetical protein
MRTEEERKNINAKTQKVNKTLQLPNILKIL